MIASGTEGGTRKKREEEMWFSVRRCGIKSHIKSFGVIAQRPASAKSEQSQRKPEKEHDLFYKLFQTPACMSLHRQEIVCYQKLN